MRRRLHGADPALAEIELGVERFDAQGEALHLEGRAGDLGDEPLDDLEVQRVPFSLPGVQLAVALRRRVVANRLGGQRAGDRRGIEEELEDRVEQLPQRPHEAVVRLIERGFVERRLGIGGRGGNFDRFARRAASSTTHRPVLSSVPGEVRQSFRNSA